MKEGVAMRKIACVVLALALVAGLVMGWLTMKAPPSNKVEKYQVENAVKDVEFISQEIHTVADQAALERVRNYLVERLAGMGLAPEVISYGLVQDPIIKQPVEVNNILAATPGDFDSYLLLVAHYDSSPKKRIGEDNESRGAADDGYGLSANLELARLLMEEETPLANGVKILITDGEETGLHGAEAAAKDPRVTDKVSCVFNLEARGVRGPVVMFETSANNRKLIELYQKAENPFTYSLATAVYRVMPNATDFTPFINAGIPGLNFACMETLEYYHNKNDNFGNINLNTMRHYGDLLYPMIKEFTSSPVYSDVNWARSGRDAIAFTPAPGVLVAYSPLAGYILLGALALLAAVALLLLARRKMLAAALFWLAKWAALMLAAALAGLGVSLAMSRVSGIPFNPTYMPKVPFADVAVLLSGLVVAAALGLIVFRSVKKKGSAASATAAPAALVGGVLLQLLLTAALAFLLPGGAFLYLFPGILFSLAALAILTDKRGIVALPIAALAVFYTSLTFAPMLMLFNIALTIGALAVVLLLETVALATTLPAIIISIINCSRSCIVLDRSARTTVRKP
jgi:hypothetical protein